MDTGPKSWLNQLLKLAVGLVVLGLLLHWAWELLRPVLPFGLGIIVLLMLVAAVHWWRRSRFW
jgi:hypothetical protein